MGDGPSTTGNCFQSGHDSRNCSIQAFALFSPWQAWMLGTKDVSESRPQTKSTKCTKSGMRTRTRMDTGKMGVSSSCKLCNPNLLTQLLLTSVDNIPVHTSVTCYPLSLCRIGTAPPAPKQCSSSCLCQCCSPSCAWPWLPIDVVQ